MVSAYLYYHGFYVQWGKMLEGGGQTKFYNKLNECHKRMGKPGFEKYFEYLLDFFSPFVVKKEELLGG